MTTTTLTRPLPLTVSSTRTPFVRLVRAEMRKLVNMRAGRWLAGSAIVLSLLTAALAVVGYRFMPPELQAGNWYATTSHFVSLWMSVLLPPMVILLVTTEWTQRTLMTTFTLEPRRLHVIAAKGAVFTIVTAAMFGFATLLSAGTYSLATAAARTTPDWTTSWSMIGGSALTTWVGLAMAFGFALAMRNTAAAIVAFMALPAIVTSIASFPGLGSSLAWLDLTGTQGPIAAGTATASQWAIYGVATLIWVVVPTVIGALMHAKADVS